MLRPSAVLAAVVVVAGATTCVTPKRAPDPCPEGDCGELQACPVVDGIDGSGVCDPWELGTWDNPCTGGYTRVRTCEPGYDCRTTDHNACDAGLEAGRPVPEGCDECGACAAQCTAKICGDDDGCGTPCALGSGCTSASSLQYLGYWRDTYFAGSWMQETQTHANFTMIEDGTYAELLAEARGYGVGVLLTPPAPVDWATALPTLAPHLERIIGFNVLDDADVQPDWPAAKAAVESYASVIHADVPGAHIYINLAGRFRDIPDFALPAGVDWVGLECYFGVADCDDMVTQLTPKLPEGGRIWVMPPAHTGYGTEEWLVSTAQEMYDWALTRPVIIGMNVFVWQTELLFDATYQGQLATRDLPALRLKFCQIGRAITGRGDVAACP